MMALAGVLRAEGPKVETCMRSRARSGSLTARPTGRARPRRVTTTLWNCPTPRSGSTWTTPSISGASRCDRATPGSSTRTSIRSPTRAARRSAVTASWSSEHSRSRSSASSGGTAPAALGVGAGLRGEGEEARPVEPGLGQERQQEVVVVLGLPGVAEDERRTQGGVGGRGADGGDALQEPLAVTPAPHAPTRGRDDVLQRQVEVGHARGHDGVDRASRRAPRGTGRAAGPADPLRQAADEPTMGDGCRAGAPGAPRPRRVAVEPPRRQVLGDEDHLLHGVTELVHLGQHGSFGARSLQAPERRDGAEAAAPVTALGHLHIGPRGVGGGPGQVQEVEGGEGPAGGTLVGEGAGARRPG